MSFKSKIISLISFLIVFSFCAVSAAFAFSFSGFGDPLKPYKKEDKQGKEQTYNWHTSLGIGESWTLASGHLGEDYVLRAKKDVDGNDIGRAEIGQPVYSIADGVVFQVADWPECGSKNHGWGGVVLIKHQIPKDAGEKFNLGGTILPDPRAKDKKAEKERIKKLEEKGTKTIYSMYGHLKNISVKKGQSIKKGDKMGEIGDVCYRNSAKKYSPHLHFEIKNQEAIDGENKDFPIDKILGIGRGYSKITNLAPNRYIPSKFIENNKDLIIKEKSITQRIGETAAAIISLPEGIVGEEENLSFWDKTKFYWNGFWANAGELFGRDKLKETEKQAEEEKQKEDKEEEKEIETKKEVKKIENSSLPKKEGESPLIKQEIWSQKFSGKEVLNFTVIAKEEKTVNMVIMQFKNTGSAVWKKDSAESEDELEKGMVSLNIIHDSGETAAKFYYEGWITKRRPCSFREKEVKPGELATFQFTIAFPEKLGKYYPQFRPVYFNGENFQWIGGDKGIFVAEVKKGSSGLEFAAANIIEAAEGILEDGKQKEEQEEGEQEQEQEQEEENEKAGEEAVAVALAAAAAAAESEQETEQEQEQEQELEPESETELELESEAKPEPEKKDKPKIVFKNIASPQNTLSFKIEWEAENEIEGGKYNFGLWNYEIQECETIKETNQTEYFFKGEDQKKYIFCAQAINKNKIESEWIKTEEIEINLLPVASFDYFPKRDDKEGEFVAAGETVVFDAIQSKPSNDNGKIVSYEWSFEDESKEVFEGEQFQKIEYLYFSSGDYIVTLTIKDDAGKESVVDKSIKVKKLTVREEWSKVFGGKEMDMGYSIKQTLDGGYVIVGFTYNDSQRSICLIKTDKDGNELWIKTYGNEIHKTGYAVEEIPGEGYIIGGISLYTSPEGNRSLSFSLIKTNLEGEEEWHRFFPVSNLGFGTVGGLPPYMFSLYKTKENGYIVIGKIVSQYYPATIHNIWLLKLNSEWEKEWERVIKEENSYFPSAVQQVADGGYIIIGFTDKNWVGKPAKQRNDYDAFLIKIDLEGKKIWEKTYGVGDYRWRSDFALSGEQTLDGGYIITGFADISGGGYCDSFLLKTNSEGNEEWRKTFNFQTWDWAYSVKQTADRGYIIVGGTNSFNPILEDIYLIKTDSKGNLVWSKTIGEEDADEIGYLVQQTTDGGYIILGNKKKNENLDIWLIKLSSEFSENE